jgi:hypothetical protein
MTSADMQTRFLILYDKVTNFDAPGYEDDEISILLTKAQERVFYSYYNVLGNKTQEGFEATEARRKELSRLVEGVQIVTPSINQTNSNPNGVFFDLPAECLFVISEEITLTSSEPCLNGKRIRVKPVRHDAYSININNPFKNPNDDLAWRLDYSNNRHEIITKAGLNIGTYHVRYIKRLTPIITGNFVIDGEMGPLDSLLDSFLHERIIDEAVKIATGVTDPQFYQIKMQEQKEGE